MSAGAKRKYVLVSARQVANAVGVTPRTAQRALKTVPAASVQMVRGNVTDLYSFDDLPASYREKIETTKESLNYRSVSHVLADPKPQWQPEVPIDELPAEIVERAHMLKGALAYFISRRNDLSFAPGELTRIAWQEYCKLSGRQVTKRTVEALIKMVMDRDGGREEFDRVEIYLPPKAKARKSGPISAEFMQRRFESIEDCLTTVRDVGSLTVPERTSIWNAAINDLEEFVAEGMTDKKAKRQIVEFLIGRVPSLCETPTAVRRQFNRKIEAYQREGVAGLCDNRRLNSGQRLPGKIVLSPDDLTPDEKLLLARANAVGGGLSQAFRELYRGVMVSPTTEWKFSDEFRETYAFDPRQNKSYVPRRLRVKLRPLLKSIEPYNHGPRAVKLAAPSARRDWSNVLAGAWYQSDDETGNHYIWSESPTGEYEYDGMRFDVLRPQILPMVDVRTDYVLSVMMLLQRHYTSQTIRSLMVKTCLNEMVGLPFEGFYFEGNIWQSRNIHSLVDFDSISGAFKKAGIDLKVRQATTPRAKVIERIFSQEQNVMQAFPGYAGRNERTDGYERVQRALKLMKRVGRPLKDEVAPWEHFMHAEQYLDHLQKFYETFNNEPQNGMRLDGLSPAEGWCQFSGGRAHHVLPDSLRYLLATEEVVTTVTTEGITLRLGNTKRSYSKNSRLGAMVGEKVIVRRNSDFPDHVMVLHPNSDPHGVSPFVVEYDESIDAMQATEEQFAALRNRRNQFTEGQRSMFRMINMQYNRTIQMESLAGPVDRARSDALRVAQDAHTGGVTERRSAASKVRQLTAEIGLGNARVKDPVKGVEDLERASALRQKLLSKVQL